MFANAACCVVARFASLSLHSHDKIRLMGFGGSESKSDFTIFGILCVEELWFFLVGFSGDFLLLELEIWR